MRSVNGQIEYLLREAVRKRKGSAAQPPPNQEKLRKDGHERTHGSRCWQLTCWTTPWPIKAGEKVLIEGETGSEELMIALVEETYRARGRPLRHPR